ncbi:alpha/beta hydrolase [Streptomyces lasalocidi]
MSSFPALAGDVEPVDSVHDAVAAAEGLEVPIRIYAPATLPRSRPRPVTVFFHGGGWVLGDLDSQDHIARMVANRSGTIVVSVDYRLAPEHRFPAGIEDAYAALTWVAANAGSFGGDGQNIAVFGESAAAATSPRPSCRKRSGAGDLRSHCRYWRTRRSTGSTTAPPCTRTWPDRC